MEWLDKIITNKVYSTHFFYLTLVLLGVVIVVQIGKVC